ncbi:hypothetical protein GPK34_00855 [Secundilactobacillus kimchicus]|uniref:hypothetical protein n=1 Tax=Secundilactobacillus kimchicus TaxID=528209 RepID=UPI001C02F8E3|nr:hypothetical protein [Secundilactobacillus kimchicus]MBT9670588.1 hypothetical protein [Secundilactobacillus kimchicus]
MSTNAQQYFKKQSGGSSQDPYTGNPRILGDESRLNEITLASLGFKPDIVRNQLLGMEKDLINPSTGKEFTDEELNGWIDLAIGMVEKDLNIVIRPRVVNERVDYNQTEFNSNMFINTNERPIIQVDDLVLQYGGQKLFDFDNQWIKVHNLFGQIEIQPAFLMSTSQGLLPQNLLVGGSPLGGLANTPMQNPQFSPQMIGITYVAGMLPQPPEERGINRFWYPHPDLIAYIAKFAAIEVLERWGRTIIGAGIAGYDISIDSISSSVNSTQSAENTGSTADIKLLQQDMKEIRASLKAYYGHSIGFLS